MKPKFQTQSVSDSLLFKNLRGRVAKSRVVYFPNPKKSIFPNKTIVAKQPFSLYIHRILAMEALSSTVFAPKFTETRPILHTPPPSSSSSSSCSLLKIPFKRSGSLKIADTSRFLSLRALPGDVSGDAEGEDASGFGLVSEESVSSLSQVSFCCKFCGFWSGFCLWLVRNWWEKERKFADSTVFIQSVGLLSGGVGITIVKKAERTMIYI